MRSFARTRIAFRTASCPTPSQRNPLPFFVYKRLEELKGLFGLGADRHRIPPLLVIRGVVGDADECALPGKEARAAPSPRAEWQSAEPPRPSRQADLRPATLPRHHNSPDTSPLRTN